MNIKGIFADRPKPGVTWNQATDEQKAAIEAWYPRPMVEAEKASRYHYHFDTDGRVTHAD